MRRTTRARNKRQTIPESVRRELADRLLGHVAKHRKNRVRKILLRFRGRHAYVAAVEAVPGEEVVPHVCRYVDAGEAPVELCRLDEKYEPSLCASGSFVATPE